MKRTILISIAFIALFETANAQRYLPEQKGIQFTAATVNGINPQKAFCAGASMSTYSQNGNHWIFGGECLQKIFDYTLVKIPVVQFTAEGGYYYSLLSDPSKTLNLSVGASALAGYETSNWGNKLLFDGATLRNKDAFLYGGALTLEMETYLSNRIVLLINARERMLWGSSIGKFSSQLGAGLKIIIN